MNKKKWDSLSAEQQKIISEAAHEALVWQRAETKKLEKKAWDAFRAKGIKIHMLSDANKAKLREKTEPVRQKFAKEVPADLLKLIVATQM